MISFFVLFITLFNLINGEIGVYSDVNCVTKLANINLNKLIFILSPLDGSEDFTCSGASIGINLIVDCDDGFSYIYDDLNDPICTSVGDNVNLIRILNGNITQNIEFPCQGKTILWLYELGTIEVQSADVLLFKKIT
jgi:hypothetical protein